MPEHIQRRSRRAFLLTVGAGGAASAAAIAAKSGPSFVSPGKAKRTSGGYQASEHVNKYYRTTKV